MKWIKGYKTYLAAFAGIVIAGVKAKYPQYADLCDVLLTTTGFTGLAFLRAGVKKAEV